MLLQSPANGRRLKSNRGRQVQLSVRHDFCCFIFGRKNRLKRLDWGYDGLWRNDFDDIEILE